MSRSVLNLVVGASTLAFFAACGGGGGGGSSPPAPPPVPAQTPPVATVSGMSRVSTDPFTNSNSEHATEVEPSILANGTTLVAAFQAGRFRTAGSSDLMYATSHDAGVTWATGTLPGITQQTFPQGPFGSVSDPVVGYDAAHATWLIAGIPVIFGTDIGPAAAVSRSPDGVTWSAPAVLFPNQNLSDKDWIACDNFASSPYYGHCYLFWDEAGANGTIHATTSTDGGVTWSPFVNPAGNAAGIGVQPAVLPNGKVVVSVDDWNIANVIAFSSNDGGISWTAPVRAGQILAQTDPGSIRTTPFVASAADASGTIYDIWPDCRFRVSCATNDIVLTTSHDGLSWSPVARIPVDSPASTADYFLPAIAVDPRTQGANARIAVTYYFYPSTPCTVLTCRLSAGFIASPDGGATWTQPQVLAGPMSMSELASTTNGAMAGDYFGVTFAAGRATGILAVAFQAASFDEAMYVTNPGTLALTSASRVLHTESAQRNVHPPRHERPGP